MQKNKCEEVRVSRGRHLSLLTKYTRVSVEERRGARSEEEHTLSSASTSIREEGGEAAEKIFF